MGSTSGKVLPDPTSKSGYFCAVKSVVGFREQGFDSDRCESKKRPCIWKWKSNPKDPEPRDIQESSHLQEERMRKPRAKYRAKFDPRVTSRYDIKALIGRGSFSRVVRAEHRRTRQPFAIKLLEVRGREGHKACQAELGVLRRVNHVNVIRLAEVFETPHRVYLVLELATGGELLERVVARGTFRERDATRAVMMVASGLCYLHKLGVIHRDLKPENLLYYHPGQNSRLIITDFGLACWDIKTAAKRAGDTCITKINTLDGETNSGENNRNRPDEIGDTRNKKSNEVNTQQPSVHEHFHSNTTTRVDTSETNELDTDRGHANILEDVEKDRTEELRSNYFTGDEVATKKSNQSLQNKDMSVTSQNTDHANQIISTCATTGFEENSERKNWALRTLCGTPEYLAPEMVARRPHSSAVDMWALGVITYILLSGSLPFDQNSRPRLFRAILRANYSFHGDPWSSVSTLAKNFIDRLLTLDSEGRMTAEDALKHPWLVSMAACSSNKNLHRSISRNLQQRASQASSRCPSSGSTPGSWGALRSARSRPTSGPRLGVSTRSECSLKIAT